MRFKGHSYIKALMVLGSSVCNLQCDYCYLRDQHKSNAYVLLNKEIQEAWKNGSYVENIKKTFNAIEADPKRVTDLEIWGGEPLILINNLIEPIQEILEYFPNIDYIQIPTNFTRINDVPEFIQVIEKTKQKIKADKKLTVHIQMSIDAPPSEVQKTSHCVNWDIYRKNIDKLFEALSKMQPLEKTNVDMEWHATLTQENIINYLSNYDNLKYYCDYYEDFHNFMHDKIKEYHLENCVIQASYTTMPNIATPTDSSVENGFEIANIARLSNYLRQQKKLLAAESDTDPYYTHMIIDSGRSDLLTTNPVCLESGVMAVTVMYDGSICECPCDYILNFDKYWDWIKDNPLKRQEYRSSLLKKQYYINPLTATQEQKDYFDWYIFDAVRRNQSTAIHLMMNFYLEMAKSGQIDITYLQDLEKLLAHTTQFTQAYTCPRDQLAYVFSPYICGQGYGRRILNGVADFAETDEKISTQFEAEGKYKWKKRKIE